MLENFRSQKIIWDRANKKIFEKIEANSGDSNGRKLVVQVINQGVIENLFGTTLSLGWKHRKGAKGLDAFNVVDASKGIFEIYYTTEMLSNIGNIEASFILVDSTSRIESSTFTISVRPSTVDDESVESENSFTALTEALVKVNDLEQNYAPRLNDLTEQLAQTKSEAERKRKLEDLDPEVLSAIEGGEGTSFNLLSIPQDKSVTPTKTTFTIEGKNKFNKDAAINGYRLNGMTGEVEVHADYYISDYMSVKPNASYMRKWNYVTAFYDKELNKISHHNHSTNFEPVVSPDLAAYARIANYKTTLVDEQFEEGTVATTYEPYKIKIPKYNIYDDAPLLKYDGYPFQALANFNNDENRALEIKKAIKAIELFGADKAKKYNMGIIQKNFSTYGTGIYIYECNLDGTNNKVVAVTSKPSYTHPLGVDTFEVAESNGSGISAKVYIDWSEISDGAQYVNNHYDKAGLDYRTYKSTSSTNSDTVRIKLPPTIQAIVGKEINVYFENIILSDNLQNYKIDVTCAIGKHQNERWTAIPTAAGNYPITITVYKNGESIASATSSIVVKAVSAGDGLTKKAIFIGDSTTDHGVYTNELINGLFSDDVMNLELLGTRGSGLNKHEGRSGWRAFNYVNDATFGGMSNAFYNNGFDFTHYMTTQGYSGVDVVGIHLGINDMFNRGNDDETLSETVNVLGHFDTMLDSIKAFDSAIKVAILVTIPPSKNQDAFGNNYNNGQTQWRVKRNIFLFVEKLIDKYKGRENEGIYLVPINVNLDTVNNMHTETVEVNSRNTKQITRQSNGVHPANEGYYQMADVIYYWLKGVYA